MAARASGLIFGVAVIVAQLFATVAPAQSVQYEYDGAGRLRKSTFADGAQRSYTLDAAGNRTQVGEVPGAGVLQLAAATASVSEGTATFSINVTRSGGTAGTATVSYATANGTATAGSDYTAKSGTISFTNGVTTPQPISITINTADTTIEANETFTITLSNPIAGTVLGAITQVTVTILDNDAASFAISNTSVNEGAGTASFTVTRGGSTAAALGVDYATANSTATAGADYTATSGTLAFAAGEVTKTFSVLITNDTTYEGNETFIAALSSPTGAATLGSPSSATATITENDAAPSFSVQSITVVEAQAGGAQVVITKSGATSLSHNVSAVVTANSATFPSDFGNVGVVFPFAANETTKTFTIPLADDTVFEGTEAFYATIQSPTNGATISNDTALVTINDNDAPPSFTISDASKSENASPLTLTVTKAGATALTHNVNFATGNGSATAGSDYAGASGTLAFAPGDTSKTISVTLSNDSTYEGDETFTATLSGATSSATIARATATATIVEDDAAPISTLQFTTSTTTVSESAASVTLNVSRANGAIGAVSVVCSTSNGSAAAGADYTALSQTLSWANGETATKPCTITLSGDSLYEGSEIFTVNLSGPSGATLGTPATHTVTLTDDDAAPVFAIQSQSIAESAGSVAVTITKTGATAFTHNVNAVVTSNSALVDIDFGNVGSVIPFAPGDTSKTFVVPITSDTLYEGNETFYATLQSPTNGATIGSDTALITINDDDAAPAFSIQSVTVNESAGNASVLITKSGATALGHDVSAVVTTNSATVGDDFGNVGTVFSFGQSETTKTFVIPIVNDTAYEGTETFYATLQAPTNGATIATTTALVTILDNDSPPAFSVQNTSVTEGQAGGLHLTITRSVASNFIHDVSASVTASSASVGTDFGNVGAIIRFQPNEMTKTFDVPLPDDLIYEGNETFYVTLSSPTNGATLGNDTALITIIENEAVPAFSIQNTAVGEAAGTLQLTVTLSPASAYAHGVNAVVVSNSAIAGVDFGNVGTVFNFPAGTTTQTFVVPITNDSTQEGEETFYVSLQSPTNGAGMSRDTALITIIDND